MFRAARPPRAVQARHLQCAIAPPVLRRPTPAPPPAPITPRRSFAKGSDKGAAEKAAAQAAENRAIKDRASEEMRKLTDLEKDMTTSTREVKEDVLWDIMRDANIEKIREQMGEAALRPHLTQKSRDHMYTLHKADPQKWDDDALAHKFGLQAARVRAILYLKELEAQARKRGDWVGGDEIDEAYQEEFGAIEFGIDEDIESDMKHEDLNKKPRMVYFDEGLNPQVLRQNVRYVPPREHEVGPTPAPEWPEKPTVISKAYEGKKRTYPSKIIMMDINKKVPDEQRLILISDYNGDLRTPTWDERRAVLNLRMVARTTSGRKNPFIPLGGAEKLNNWRMEREASIKKMDEMAPGLGRDMYFDIAARVGYKKVKEELLKFDDDTNSAPSGQLGRPNFSPSELPELNEK